MYLPHLIILKNLKVFYLMIFTHHKVKKSLVIFRLKVQQLEMRKKKGNNRKLGNYINNSILNRIKMKIIKKQLKNILN